MTQLQHSRIEKFTQRLKEEEINEGNFYICPNACVRVIFEKATDFDFKCPECGCILNHQDNGKTIDFLKKRIKEIEMGDGFKKY